MAELSDGLNGSSRKDAVIGFRDSLIESFENAR